MLIGRKEQQSLLKEALTSYKSEFIVVYGGRRVGKTFLIKSTLGEGIDFELTGTQDGNTKDQLENFTDKLSEYNFGNIGSEKPKNWREAFSLLKQYLKTLDKDKKKVI